MYHIVAIAEVKPKHYRYQPRLEDYIIPGYSIETRNIDTKTGRGLLLYINDALRYSMLDSFSTPFEEFLVCDFNHIHDVKNTTRLALVYRSPNSPEQNSNNMCRIIKDICTTQHPVIIVGDFNLPNIDWSSYSHPGSEHSLDFKFIETLRNNYLNQHITSPTRGRGSANPNILDLFLSTEGENIQDIELSAPIGKSDHCVITAKININIQNNAKPKTRPCYNKADFVSMNNSLDIDWTSMLNSENTTPDHTWKVFTDKLKEAELKFVPSKVIKPRKYKFPLDKKTRTKINQKNRIWKRYISTHDQSVYKEFCTVRNQVRRITRKAQKLHEQNISKYVKSNPKKFWSYVRSKTKYKPGIPELQKSMENPNIMTTSDKEKADTLVEYFQSVFTQEPPGDTPPVAHRNYDQPVHINITPEIVRKKLQKLNISKSPGPDALHPRILNELSHTICTPLSIIYNQSIVSGTLPSQWKTANITAIHKKGSKSLASNYRPISLTCIVCKILESIIRDAVMKHMIKKQSIIQ